VPQEPFLFSETIGENVAFGHRGRESLPATAIACAEPDTTPALVSEAAAIARLDKDVADFPQGYDTMVGERGITLSGGQKQRTALARAIAPTRGC